MGGIGLDRRGNAGRRAGEQEAASGWADLSEPRLRRLPPGRWRVCSSRCNPMGVQPRGSWGGEGGAAGQGLPAAGPRAAPWRHAAIPSALTRAPAAGLAVAQQPLLQQVRHCGPFGDADRCPHAPRGASDIDTCCSSRAGARTALLSRGRSGWVLWRCSQGPGARTNEAEKRSGGWAAHGVQGSRASAVASEDGGEQA